MILRSYQVRARDKARAEYARGSRAICYVAPTGAGKTVILADTIASHVKHHTAARVNVYAHRRELLSQAATTFRAYGLEVGIGGEGRNLPVQVLSTQGVLAKGEVEKCTMAIFDEAHHYAADTWGDVARVHKEHGAIIVGATATPERGDGRPLNHMFDSLVVVAQISELVREGHLVPCEIIRPTRALKAGQIAQTPRDAVERYAKGRRVVVFAPHVKAAKEYADGWAEVVHGGMPTDDRDAALGRFRAGRSSLVNVNVLTEGWDDPGCDCVVLARGMGSTGMYIQSCGRSMRPSPGKRNALIIDLRGVSYVLGRPDEDRQYSLDGVAISRGACAIAEERLCKMCQSVLGDAETCPQCGTFNGLETPKAMGLELEAWKVAMRQEDDGKKVERLTRWIKVLMASGKRGRSLFSAQYKYAGVYGVKPDQVTWNAAMAIARSQMQRGG